MDYGSSDTSTTSLGANQFPISEVWPPNGPLAALGGGPVSTDGSGKRYAPALMYVPDGSNVTQGTTTDPAVVNPASAASVIALLKGLLTELIDIEAQTTLTPTVTIDATNSTHLANVDSATADLVADLDTLIANTTGVATQTTLAAVLAKLVAAPALEGGHLATIDTNTASAKTDLDTIATNTTGVATAANQATGNTSLSGIATNTTGLATQATLAAAKTDLDTIVTNTNKIPASPAQEGGHLAAIDTATASNVTQVTSLNTVTGLQADAAVTGDTAGTVSGKLRGLAKMLFDMWDSTNHWLQVKVMNANGNGQSTMVGSSPVVIAADQSPVNTGLKNSAGTVIAGREPDIFKYSRISGVGADPIWTPASGKTVRLMRYVIYVSNDASLASGGELQMIWQDNAISLGITHNLYVPSTAATTLGQGWTTGWIDLGNEGLVLSAANEVLKLNLVTGLATGHITVIVAGQEN